VASAGPYANLHLDPDTTMPAPTTQFFYRPDALSVGWPHVRFDEGDILMPSSVTLLHSCVEMRAAIELSFRMVSWVTPDIHVLDGVHVPQVEWVDFEVVCPHWPNGFNVVLIVRGTV